MFGLRGQELIVILLIVVVLFGAKKIPELMKGLGKGIKEFKKGMSEDDKPEEAKQVESNAADKPEAAKPAASSAVEVKPINHN